MSQPEIEFRLYRIPAEPAVLVPPAPLPRDPAAENRRDQLLDRAARTELPPP
jgi:hypothetical protein